MIAGDEHRSLRGTGLPKIACISLISLVAVLAVLLVKTQVSLLAEGHPQPHNSPVSAEVTLISGHIVRVNLSPDGPRDYRVYSANPNYTGTYRIWKKGDDTYVLPTGLDTSKLDKELFNVDYLIRENYHEKDTLPVIIATTDSSGLATVGRMVDDFGGAVTFKSRALPLLAAKLPLTALRTTSVTPWKSNEVSNIFLDKVARANLDGSVPVIGAPEVWNMGYRGEGIQIAILDTGIDETHPDLDDLDDDPATNDPKVIQARDFTDDASTGDVFGHGTHVSGIAAGTGFLFGGQFTGVAPGAFLWNAKVLNSQGFGFNSWIIAGIEFAALGPDGVAGTDDEADVINMSLGAPVNGDGSDPLSLAVDFATGQGLVVAVAAGNSGPDMFSVGQPAVSRTAITVGATNDFDQMAGFSSRGPTLDLRIKPDVTGPGVAITSTQAGGGYVSFNGTSMATPHVAGAAGLILQAHPDWDPMMVKAALMNNALVLGGPRLWDQGAGRIRVPQAVNTTLMAMEPSFSFGVLTSGDLVTADLTVRNLTGVEATVNLTTFTTVDGLVTSDLVTVVPAGLTIPASGSAVATLTVGPVGAAPQGWYEGRITVSGDHDTLTVPYLFKLEQNPEIHVTPDAISGDGTFLETVTRTLTITNSGQSDLTFAMGVALAEQVGAAEAALPASQARNWVTEKERIAGSRSDGSRPGVTEAPAGPQQLAPIIQDPEGDSGIPNVDILRLDGGTHGATATLQIFFSDAAAFAALLGYVHLDVDQNPLTGVPPGDWFGLPEQDIGADFVLVVESSSDVGPAVNVLTLTLVDAVGRNIKMSPESTWARPSWWQSRCPY